MELLKRLLGLVKTPPPERPARHDLPSIRPGLDDLITGWRYCATLQARTPFAILRQHNRLVPASHGNPPVISDQMWHGIWTPEIEGSFDFLNDGATMASEVGPIPRQGGDYLPYLVDLRTIAEGSLSLEDKEAALRQLAKARGTHGTAFSKFGTAEELVDMVLPRTLHLLPVPANVRQSLLATGYTTLASVQTAPDQALLAIRGLGAKSLIAIKEFFHHSDADLDATRYLAQDFQPLPRQGP